MPFVEIDPCKIIQLLIYSASQRSFSRAPENATLFYDVKITYIYDGTELWSPVLITLDVLNPDLTSLRIDYCGRLEATLYPR